MKVSFTTVIILLFLVASAMGQSSRIMEGLSMQSEILDQEVRYSIVLPENYYEEERSYAVVYLLHGLGDDETAWIEYGRINQYADPAVEEGEILPMIFVIPQGFRTYYVNDFAGTFLYQDMFVKELVPFIDSHYRTLADRDHRAIMGYSMGGFGALILPLKHPDLFRTCVPLSISIRTDEQYMAEDSSEWDQQWGRLFGGIGTTGKERITEYFRQNYPFHIFLQEEPSGFSDLNIYIDNGDDEQTLCRSNEELHILMRDKGFAHRFRVRNGGHSFEYWRSALPDALRFISDAFTGIPYRGDLKQATTEILPAASLLRSVDIGSKKVPVFVPEEYDRTTRLYPVIYFAANLAPSQCEGFASVAVRKISHNEIGPLILVFLPADTLGIIQEAIPSFEKALRIRTGYRFRSLAGCQDMAQEVLGVVTGGEKFRTCLLLDGYLQKEGIESILSAMDEEALKNTTLYVDAPESGSFYEGNGTLHMLLRDRNLKHEYRVREGSGGFGWCLENFDEILQFTDFYFHK